MRDSKPVKKCVCGDVTFAALKAAGIETLEDAAERFTAGETCGLCRPYIAKMLKTGETEFAVIEGDE